MFLVYIALDKFGQTKKYSWWFSTLEAALDTLSSLSAQGRPIVWAELVDQQQRIELLVSAFDGRSFCQPLQQLQDQWQSLLNQPPYMPLELVSDMIVPLSN